MHPTDPQPDLYSLSALNTLDQKYDPATDRSIEPDQLLKQFPFLFKPNRLCSSYPRGPSESRDFSRGPMREGRWLFRLTADPEVFGGTLLGVIGRNGLLTLWKFIRVRETGDGPAPHPGLHPQGVRQPGGAAGNFIDLNALAREQPTDNDHQDMPQTAFNLLRVVQYGDGDGRHFIRLHSTNGEHTLTLRCDEADEITLQYAWRRSTEGEEQLGLQVGGWDRGKRIVWHRRQQAIQAGTGKHLQNCRYAAIFGAVEHRGEVFLGGDERQPHPSDDKQRDDKRPALRGVANRRGQAHHALNIVPDVLNGGNTPLLLAGSDDYYLNALAADGRVLARCLLHGRVRGILVMGRQADVWVDLVVLVRGHGLQCLRLWLDRLPDSNGRDRERDRFVAQLRETAGSTAPAQDWLESPDKRRQIVILYLWARFPDLFTSIEISDQRLTSLEDDTVDWLLHGIERFLVNAAGKADADAPFVRRLEFIRRLSRSTEHARRQAWEMLGRLRGIELTAGSDQQDGLEICYRHTPDVKRDFLERARHIIRATRGDEKNLGRLVATYSALRHDHLFTQLVVGAPGGRGPVRAVTMAGSGRGQVAQIYADDRGARLRAFYIDADERQSALKPAPEWEKDLRSADGEHDATISSLVGIDNQRVLIAQGPRLGLVRKGQAPIEWWPPCPAPIRTLAIDRLEDGGCLIVAAGECPVNTERPSLMQGFQLAADQDSPRTLDLRFPAPADWGISHSLADLVWLESGNLWGITREEGRVLVWPDARRRMLEGENLEAREFKRMGMGQHTLAVAITAEGTRVVSGGVDGVARCFDGDANLLWSFPTGGPVRAIQTVRTSQTPAATELMVLTENQHLFRLDLDGQKQGLLFMPGVHPVAMCSRDAGLGLHHLIGSLEGQVRLVETVDADAVSSAGRLYERLAGDYAPPTHQLQPQAQRIDQTLVSLAANTETLRDWCQWEAARAEPLRAAWAGHHLVEQSEFQTVIELLGAIRPHFDPSLLTLRAHLAGTLGRAVSRIGIRDRDTLFTLNATARDGAFASLLDHISPTDFDDKGLPPGLIRAIHSKVLRQARPFTTAALLALIHRVQRELPAESWHAFVEVFLIAMLLHSEKHQRPPPGLADGLLASSFFALGQEAALAALAKVPETFPRLTDKLLADEGFWQRFLELLTHHAERMVSPRRAKAGRGLLDLVTSATERRGWEQRMRRLHSKLRKEGESPDVKVLSDFFGQLPGGTPVPPCPPWDDALPGATDLYQRVAPLYSGDLSPVRTRQLLERARRLLNEHVPQDKTQVPSGRKPRASDMPCFRQFQQLWYRAWDRELESLKQRLLPKHPADYLRLTIDDPWRVPDDPVLLHLRLHNEGPEDIRSPVRLWLVPHRRLPLAAGSTDEVTVRGLACADEQGPAAPLSLDTRLELPSFQKEIELTVCWEVEGETRRQTHSLTLRKRWEGYQARYPDTDRRAIGLLPAAAGRRLPCPPPSPVAEQRRPLTDDPGRGPQPGAALGRACRPESAGSELRTRHPC